MDQRPHQLGVIAARVEHLHQQRAVGRMGALHERQLGEHVKEGLRPSGTDDLDADRCGPALPAQSRWRIDQEQRATHDPDSIAQPLGLVEVMRADDDRAACVAQGRHEVTHRLGG
ncbi:MAG: hypothetical protein LC798_06155 [Chloroflexi bacterium]|nr:hypothetical protein [Chloroflexota bacterium]